MNKIVIILLAAVVIMAACRKKDIATFHGVENIYFKLDSIKARDSLLYTFALHPEKAKDTIWVPVIVAGNQADRDRMYSVKIIDTGTTAEVNKHYEPLKEQYVFRAGRGVDSLPLILYNTDTLLFRRTYSLMVQLVATDDFNTDLSKLITARLVFSNKLEKPNWWDLCPGGDYSIVKHQLFRLAATTEDVTTDGLAWPIRLYYNDKFQALLISPATWIANNPDKGYVLTKRSEEESDFYEAQSPDKKFVYKKDTASGNFYFINENGKSVK